MSSSSYFTARPEFKTISVEAGSEFIKKVTEFCIDRYPDIVPIISRGILPLDMLEHPLSASRGSNIGRKAGYINAGSRILVDQTAAQYREEIIASTITASMPLSTASSSVAHTGALSILFPESGKITREKSRSTLDNNIRALLQFLSMSWPSEDIQIRMSIDVELNEAYDRQDLIAWVRAFNKFCLNSSGNKEINAQRAEKTIEAIKMSSLDLAKYVKAFVKAAENLTAVGSLYTELKIVNLFVKNLNQSENVFNNIHRSFLDKHQSAYILQANNLAYAVKYAEDYFKDVISPKAAEMKEAAAILNTSKEVQSKVSQMSKRGGSASDRALVPFTVLATILNEKRKALEDLETANKKLKAKGAAKLKADAAVVAKPGSIAKPPGTVATVKKTQKCWLFAKNDCTYGDSCKFAHTA